MSIITRLGRLARWWRERCLSDLINKREGETMSIRAYLCSQDARLGRWWMSTGMTS